jgi:hypothetical protein
VLALRPTSNLEDQSPEFMSPWGRVARLYPRALGGSGTSGAPLPVPTMWTPESVYIGGKYDTPETCTTLRRLKTVKHLRAWCSECIFSEQCVFFHDILDQIRGYLKI